MTTKLLRPNVNLLTLTVVLVASFFYTEYECAAVPLDPAGIPKFVQPLVIPPAMPRTNKVKQKGAKNIEYYEIAVRQFQQQILPAGYPMTTVWSYGSINHPGSFNYPAFTIEAKYNKPASQGQVD